MQQDEIIFVLEEDLAGTKRHDEQDPGEKEPGPVKKKRGNRLIIYIMLILAAAVVTISGALFISRERFKPVFFYVNPYDRGLYRILENRKPEKILEADKDTIKILTNPNTGDAYIWARTESVFMDHNAGDYSVYNSIDFLYYVHKDSKPVLLMDGYIRDIFSKGGKVFLVGNELEGPAFGDDVFELTKDKKTKLASNVVFYTISARMARVFTTLITKTTCISIIMAKISKLRAVFLRFLHPVPTLYIFRPLSSRIFLVSWIIIL